MEKRIAKRIIACLAAAFVLCMAAFSSMLVSRVPAFAAESGLSDKFDATNVLDDLEGSTIEGKQIDLKSYLNTLGKDTEVLSLMEFCYAADPDFQKDFGLYLYVYNPKKYQFANNSELNRVQLSFDETENYKKYPLQFLNASVKEGYEGLFFKYKVAFTVGQRKETLEVLEPEERVYRVGEVELQPLGDDSVCSVAVAKNYRFTGFVRGYGSETGNLQSRTEETDVITLRKDKGEVGFTWFRPNGSNGKNEYTRDSLHSVYFVVPNNFIERYGVMTEVHATWRDAVLAPALVTGNKEAYDAISPFLGEKMDPPLIGFGGLGLCYLGALKTDVLGNLHTYTYGYGFNVPGSAHDSKEGMGDSALSVTFRQRKDEGSAIDPLYMMYFSGDEIDSADKFQITPDEITEMLKRCTADYGGELVNGKYSRALFDDIADSWEDKTFTNKEKTQPLTEEVIDSTWWERLWGSSHVESHEEFNGIEAIHTVTEEDFEDDKSKAAQNLYIDETCYDEIKSSFDRHKQNGTMFLLRYQVSDYVAQEASLIKDPGWSSLSWVVDTNAYFFQETVNLDFDIIDATFSDGGAAVKIPVAMTPFDVIPGSDSPLKTHSDKSGGAALAVKIVLLAMVIVIAIIAIYYLSDGMKKGAEQIKPKKKKGE